MIAVRACVISAEGHYEEHRGKPFFAGLASFFASGPIVAMVREANNRRRSKDGCSEVSCCRVHLQCPCAHLPLNRPLLSVFVLGVGGRGCHRHRPPHDGRHQGANTTNMRARHCQRRVRWVLCWMQLSLMCHSRFDCLTALAPPAQGLCPRHHPR